MRTADASPLAMGISAGDGDAEDLPRAAPRFVCTRKQPESGRFPANSWGFPLSPR